MVEPASLGAYVLVALLVTITPGADTLLVTRTTMLRGLAAGTTNALGIVSGLFLHAILSALGLSLILARSAVAFQVIKYVGAAYLAYLGLRTLHETWSRRTRTNRDRSLGDPAPGGAHAPRPHHDRTHAARSLTEGFLSNILNPKVALFYLTFLPQFVNPAGNVLTQSLMLGAIHAAMGLVWLLGIALTIGKVSGLLQTRRAQRTVGTTSGGALVGLAAGLALDRTG